MQRAVPYTPLGPGLILWGLLVGLLLVVTARQFYRNYLFTYQSRPAAAQVERKWATSRRARFGYAYTYHVAYLYPAGDRQVLRECIVREATYQSLPVGGTAPVVYLQADPRQSRLDLPFESQFVRQVTSGFAALTFAWLGIGGIILVYYERRNRLNRSLLATGLACEGVVSTINYDAVGRLKLPRYFLTFTFRDRNDSNVTGRTWYLEPGTESRWREGSTIRVYYDPANPANFTVDLGVNSSSR